MKFAFLNLVIHELYSNQVLFKKRKKKVQLFLAKETTLMSQR